MPKSEKKEKRGGGRDQRSWFNTMRARAWVEDLKRRTGAEESHLQDVLITALDFDLAFKSYREGLSVPTITVRNAIHQDPQVAKSRFVFDIGPEDAGEIVPFWILFEERYEEFAPIIRDIGFSQAGEEHASANEFGHVAHVFLPPDQWAQILSTQAYAYMEKNPVVASWESGFFKTDLRFLAAVIAQWRLCIFNRNGVAPMEYLLHCLLAKPYKNLLENHNIYENVCSLTYAIAAQNHALQGNVGALELAFSGLPVITEPKKKTSNGKKK